MANFSISQNEGFVNITRFQFDVTPLSSYKYSKYLWDFGDGVRSREFNPTHFYTNPSSYKITLNAYTATGIDIYEKEIKVDLYLNNSIYFDYVPPPTFAGHLNRYPFKINITSPDLDEHVIDLYANFSRSYAPQDKNSKWTFLRPQWRFLDKNGNQIYHIKTQDTIIKADNSGRLSNTGIVAGVTGTAEFYFVDDIYNFDLAIEDKPYTTIVATLRTASTKSFNDVTNINPELPSDSNSLAQTVLPYIVLWRTPDYLKITENGIREHSNPRWIHTKNPVIINSDFKTLEYPDIISDGNGVSVFDKQAYFCEYIPSYENETISISAGFQNISANIFPKPIAFKLYDDDNFKSAGYYKGNFIIGISAKNITLSAAAHINVPNLSGNYYNPLIWIPNPAAGNLNVIQYIKNDYNKQIYLNTQNILNQEKAIVHNINMPLVSSADFLVDSMALTGHHGINCIAALPLPCYHAWVIDSDLNQIYRMSSQGQTLCSINLKSLLNKPYVSPSYGVLDKEQNLWVTLHDTSSTLKFDKFGNLLFSVSPFTNTFPPTASLNFVRTNILPRSNTFTASDWVKSRITVTSLNNEETPFGTFSTINKLVLSGNTVASRSVYEQTPNASVLFGNDYTFSIYVKPLEVNQIALQLASTGDGYAANRTAYFALTGNGSVHTVTSTIKKTNITKTSNGWYRCSITSTADDAASGYTRAYLYLTSSLTTVNVLGDDTSGLLVWGAQFEQTWDISPTDFIETTTTAITVDDLHYKYLFDSQYYKITADNGLFIENFIDPTCIDIDIDNNAWVTYSNPFSSFVCKISSNGVPISSIPYPLYSSPTEIICDNQNNVWVALTNQTYQGKSYLEKRNSLGVKLSTFGPFRNLSYLTIDSQQNPWFIHSYQYIGAIINNSLTSYKIPLNGIYKNPPNWIDKTTYITEPSSKNFTLWSNVFENSYWNKHQVTIIPNSETAPNGLEAAEYVVENAGLSGMYALSSSRVDLSGINVGSIYAKMDTRWHIQLSLVNATSGSYASAVFNLSTGSVTGLSGSFGIYELENNWYRCYVSGNINEGNNRFLINLHDGISSIYVGTSSLYEQISSGIISVSSEENNSLYQQNVSSITPLPQPTPILYGIYIWGSQWELGPTPTSYIATSAIEVTRPDTTINVIGNIDDSALKGIAFNGKDNIYIVNSLENELVVFDVKNKNIKDRFYINPKGFNFYPNQEENIINRGSFLKEIISVGPSTNIEYHPWLNSMMVAGDWTSWRWSNKFKNIYSNTKHLSGTSRSLDFYIQNPYEIYKKDENYDLAKQMKSLAFIPSLQESEFLFDKFLKNIFGNKNHEDLGVLVYEKISNYLDNHSNIDTCNINSLYNLAASVDLDSDDFRLNYPFLIRRLMDLASINKTRLWGDKDKTTSSFGDATKTGVLNRGNLLNTLTYEVTAGVPVILKTKSLLKYNLILTGPIKETINNITISKLNYNLDKLSNFIGLPSDWNQYYEFYEYIPVTSNKQLEGAIDWSNPNTTLNYNISSLSVWDGNEGILETAFNYELYKGLNLLNSN